ncbi:hypothetical protein MKJ04_21500 [Pontibacter sp. E15-1]|uniref:hypothetical protein n=1 Tax=Pontibacter sp. E15-1 TaxID=2919918 RepID=UPI001F4FB3ED|nr:hypothetical protein [Pontibacter sp. E15-1]MCJ8167431.1 hypothetical protein [Pontibacter sp. E15-1]
MIDINPKTIKKMIALIITILISLGGVATETKTAPKDTKPTTTTTASTATVMGGTSTWTNGGE